MTVTEEPTDPTAVRLRALVEYLRGLYALRRDPVRHARQRSQWWLDESRITTDDPGVRLRPTSDEWLTVQRLPVPPLPELPPELMEVVFVAARADARPVLDQDRIIGPEQRQLADRFNRWLTETWEPWDKERARFERAQALFNDLNNTRRQTEENRDVLELVWGFVRLQWSAQGVDHPLVIVPADIAYEPEDASISVFADGMATTSLECISGLPVADLRKIEESLAEHLDGDADLWTGIDESQTMLIRNAVSHDAGDGRSVQVSNTWCLYLRHRQSGYFEFLASFEEHAGEIAGAPSLGALVAEDPRSVEPESADIPERGFLLPKAANAEQRRILEEAARGAGVTVEGPPGTGKSHTIANLVCALIAEGKRVLVTAEKEQALNVLYEKLPEPVRPLCVPALGTGQLERQRLVHSVDGISAVNARLATFGPDDIRKMQSRLDEIARERESLSARLLRLRTLDRTGPPPAVAAAIGASETPETALDIARWLGGHDPELGYIPDPIALDEPIPLAEGELDELRALIGEIDSADATAAIRHLPDLELLPDAALLRAEDAEREEIVAALDSLPAEYAPPDPLVLDRQEYADLIEELRAVAEHLIAWNQGWQLPVVQAITEPLMARHWETFRDHLVRERNTAITSRTALQGHRVVPVGTEPITPAETTAIVAALAKLRSGKGLGVTDRAARRALRRFTVDDAIPTDLARVQLVAHWIDLQRSRDTLRTLLAENSENIDLPTPGPELPEDVAGTVAAELTAMVEYRSETIPSLDRRCKHGGAALSADPTADECVKVATALQTIDRQHRLEELTSSRHSLVEYLASPPEDASPLWGQVRDALQVRDDAAWAAALTEVRRLAALSPTALRLDELATRLRKIAPRWTDRIMDSRGEALGDPKTAESAWRFQQVETWFSNSIGNESSGEITDALDRLRREQEGLIGELVAAAAWTRVGERIDGPAQRALAQFKAANNRLGMGKGKYAPRLRRQIREALDDCRHVVPVWIMTVERAFSDFRCAAEPPFDVMIVDEASQIPVTRVPIFGLASRVIVVGDDKQISPTNPGVDHEAAFRLAREHLQGVVPEHEVTFDLNASLYDVARERFPRRVLLTEHFRCLPEIIGFSNARYYENSLVPLRDRLPAPRWRQTYSVFLENGMRDANSCNRAEADYAAHLIAELIKRPEYDGMTFGVISLLNSAGQIRLIQDCIDDRVGAVEVERREIRVGDSARFQGDERDVIIISMVVSADGDRAIGAFSGQRYQQMVNVAASRARNQLWVLHSAPVGSFSANDERLALIRHCTDIEHAEEVFDDLEQRIDHRSPFERDMLRELIARGYRTIRPQFAAGRYRIDFVIEGPDSRLALECDGDRFHGPDEWESDRARQEVLERVGWRFVRVRGTAFYRHRTEALAPLWEALDEMGIPPGDWREPAPALDIPAPPPPGYERGAQTQTRRSDPPPPNPTPPEVPDGVSSEAETSRPTDAERETNDAPSSTDATTDTGGSGRRSWADAFRNADD